MPKVMLDLQEEVKRDSKIAAGWLLYYEERKKEYERQREAILHSSGPCLTEVTPAGKSIGDPTGRKVVRLGELQYAEEWLKLVEEVERRLPPKMQIFLQLRREYRHRRGRHGWVAPVQWKYAEKTGQWVENRRTFYVWWNRIVAYTVILAAKRKLL